MLCWMCECVCRHVSCVFDSLVHSANPNVHFFPEPCSESIPYMARAKFGILYFSKLGFEVQISNVSDVIILE